MLIAKPVAVIGASSRPMGCASRAKRSAPGSQCHRITGDGEPGALCAAKRNGCFDADGRLIDPATQGSLRSLLVAFGGGSISWTHERHAA